MTLFHYKPDSGNWEYGNFKCQKLDLSLLNDMLTNDNGAGANNANNSGNA